MRKFCVDLLASLALLLTIMSLSAYGNIHTCHGAGADQESSEKAAVLLFLGEIARVDLDAYSISLSWGVQPSLITDYFYPGHVVTSVSAHLVSSDSEFKARIDFIDGKFYSYALEPKDGTLATKPRIFANAIEMAKFALKQYGSSFDASYCSNLEDTLDRITQTGSKQEIEADDAVLTFIPSQGRGAFGWRFKMNNATSSQKKLTMVVDEQNFLSMFDDGWGHYRIGSATVNLSRKEAIDTALGIVRTDADKMNLSDSQKASVRIIQMQFSDEGAKIAASEATLRFDNSRGDCFTLDMAWSVTFHYDRRYSYGMDGFEVCMLADTGQIFAVKPQGYYDGGLDSDQNETTGQSSPSTYFAAVLAVAISLIATAIIFHRKRRHQET